jgi:hypothetical protein
LGPEYPFSFTEDGFTFLDRLSFDPNNEGEDLKAQVLAYRRRYGHSPAVVCADQIYRIRSNRAFCVRHGIRLIGPRLGRPKSDPDLVAEEKRQFLDDQRRCNAVEEKFGQCKRRYGLDLMCEKLALSKGSNIVMNILVMSLEKIWSFFMCFLHAGFFFSGPEDRLIMTTLTPLSNME